MKEGRNTSRKDGRKGASMECHGGGGEAALMTQICSITETGLVFQSSTEMTMGVEVGLTVQTSLFGRRREWRVQGFVVLCQMQEKGGNRDEGLPYKVELLFSQVPARLRFLLSQVRGNRLYLYPPVEDDREFGLN